MPADGRRAVRATSRLQAARAQPAAQIGWRSIRVGEPPIPMQAVKGDSNEAGVAVIGRPHACAARCS